MREPRDAGHGGIAWVLGGGSGIGRAIAVHLAEAGWTVAVSGRRAEKVDETVGLIRARGGQALPAPVDVADAAAVRAAHERIRAAGEEVAVLVFAAGTNSPQRWWETLTADRFARIVDTNLNGAVNCIVPVLPAMRDAGGGTIVLVGSWSGWRFMSVAAAAYSSSKAAMAALAESLNDQEGRSGVRTTLVIPGEVDTEIAATRPVPPSAEERQAMLDPGDIARVVEGIVALPAHVCVNEIVVSGVLNGIYLRDSAYKGPVRVSGRS